MHLSVHTLADESVFDPLARPPCFVKRAGIPFRFGRAIGIPPPPRATGSRRQTFTVLYPKHRWSGEQSRSRSRHTAQASSFTSEEERRPLSAPAEYTTLHPASRSARPTCLYIMLLYRPLGRPFASSSSSNRMPNMRLILLHPTRPL